jgi:hypothetical protein
VHAGRRTLPCWQVLVSRFSLAFCLCERPWRAQEFLRVNPLLLTCDMCYAAGCSSAAAVARSANVQLELNACSLQ